MSRNELDLPEYRILASDKKDHDYHIKVETMSPRAACGECIRSEVVGYGRVEVLVHDLPKHGRRVGIYIDARRFKCKACGKTFMEKLPGVNPDRRMTERLVENIGKRSLQQTFTSIADDIGVTEGTIRNVFSDYVNELQRTVQFETPKWMGIDEIHIIKQPRAVISNLGNRTAINLLPNRFQKTVATYLDGLDDKDAVKYVAIDMWKPYKDAVHDVLPDAKVVVDKFHVQRMGNHAFDEFRRSLGRKDSAGGATKGKVDIIRRKAAGTKKDIYLFRKRERDLNGDERARLADWINKIPELGEAYRLKEAYYDIYEAPNKKEARRRYRSWAQDVTDEFIPAFSPILTAWSNWDEYILAYFDHRITNAFTESLNNLIRVMNRLGRGYSFEALRARILYSQGSHKLVLKKPAFKRQEYFDKPQGGHLMERSFGIATPIQTKSSEPETLNYGVDIDRLVAMIEAGTA